ncbi:hypothetical protein ACRAWD_02460 [Caulobacter segnis]
MSFFYEGLSDPIAHEVDAASAAAERVVTEFLNTPEGLELAAMFPKIGKSRMRRQILDLARAVVEEDDRKGQG